MINDNVSSSKVLTLNLIEKLIKKLKHGRTLGRKIYKLFRISINSGKNYNEILNNEHPIEVMKKTLNSVSSNKLEIVKDFMAAFELNKDEVVNLKFLVFTIYVILKFSGF